MLGDAVRAELPWLRLQAESLMVDTATVSRPGEPTFNPETGLMDSGSSLVWRGRCRLRQPTGVEREVLFGDQQVAIFRFVVDVPHGVTAPRAGDVVTLRSNDPMASLREFKIVSVSSETHTVCRSLGCEVVE